MRTAPITFCVAILGAELTAATFIVASNSDEGFRSLSLPALAVLSALAATLAGLIAWPLIDKSWPSKHSLRFVLCLYGLTLGGTFATVRYANFGFFGPFVSFLIALLAARSLTVSRASAPTAN